VPSCAPPGPLGWIPSISSSSTTDPSAVERHGRPFPHSVTASTVPRREGSSRSLYSPLQAEAGNVAAPLAADNRRGKDTAECPPPTAPTSCAKHSPAVTKQPRVLGRKRRWICASPLASGQRALQGGEPRKEHPPLTASTPALSTGPAVTRQPRVLGPSRHQSPPDVTSHPISLTPTGPRQGPSH
jgi:hypothetical protein